MPRAFLDIFNVAGACAFMFCVCVCAVLLGEATGRAIALVLNRRGRP